MYLGSMEYRFRGEDRGFDEGKIVVIYPDESFLKVMAMRLFFLPILLLLFIPAGSQSISGIWEGNNEPSHYIKPERVVLEIWEYNDSLITGVSHLYYSRGRYEHHKLSGRINKRTSRVYLSEDSIISYKVGLLQVVDEGTYTLRLFKKEDEMILQGDWVSRRKRLFIDPTVRTRFHKDIKQEIPTLSSDNAQNPLKRVDDIQLVLEIDKKEKDSIRVDIYDNGEIDHDSISVYVNNIVVISKQQVSVKPLTFYLSVTNNEPYDKIRMVAENLGSIPPNTALMVITTRKRKYNVFVSSNFEKNAVVEFFLKDK